MNIFIRTNYNNKLGLGHIFRTLRLAEILTLKGHRCIFFVDRKKKSLTRKYQFINLYSNKLKFKDEITDAKIFGRLTQFYETGIVILDDYRFNYKWEKYISNIHKKILIFDDLENQKHYADIIVNYNPKHFPNIHYQKENNLKKKSKLLIHPKYSLISKNKLIKNFKFYNNLFYITFYLGGGGDLKKFHSIIKYILSNSLLKKGIRIIIIIGILSKNKNLFRILSNKYKNLILIENETNIYYIIKKSNLLFSSAGTMVYESAFLKTATVFFEISKNQKTNIHSLENIGHYFLLQAADLKKTKLFVSFFLLLIDNYKEVANLNKKALLKIDNLGGDRVVDHILDINHKKNETVKYSKKNFSTNLNYVIREIKLTDINHYLFCRNKKINKSVSSSKNDISNLEHYCWWFTNNRNSYVLIRNDYKLLYLYQQKIKIFRDVYWISGFFVNDKATFPDVLYALNWQKKRSRNDKWIQFIHKKNIVFNNISSKLGWKLIDYNNFISKYISRKYKLDIKSFYFYER